MSGGKDYTMAEIRRIAAGWAAGVTLKELAKLHGRTEQALSSMMQQHRSLFPRRFIPASPSKINRAELARLRADGVSVKQIAQHFGSTTPAVYYAIKAAEGKP